MRLIPAVLAALLAAAIAPSAFADTAEVKTQTIVEVKRRVLIASKTRTVLTVITLRSNLSLVLSQVI